MNWWATKIINNKLKINWTKVGKIKLLAQKVELGWLEKGLSGEFGSILERLIKNYQITRFKKDPRTRARGSEVWWSDEEIGLHPFKKS